MDVAECDWRYVARAEPPDGVQVARADGVGFDSTYGWHPLSVAAALANLSPWGWHKARHARCPLHRPRAVPTRGMFKRQRSRPMLLDSVRQLHRDKPLAG